MTEQKPQAINDNLIASDLESGLLLLSYAAQSGLEVDAETAKMVARSKDLLAGGQLKGDDLAAYYLAYQKLSSLVAPVTVAGLRAAMATGIPGAGLTVFGRGTMPESRKAIRWYWLWTVFWMLILVSVQIYWVIGSTAVSSLKQLNEEKNKVRYELMLLKAKLPKGTVLEDSPDGKRLIESVENLRNRVGAYTRILDKWNRVIRFGIPPIPEAAPEANPTPEGKKETESTKVDVMLARTPFVLFALQAYVLPLLYGLLGACTYVLRMLSRDVRSFSYTPESHIRYKIRLVLGTLSGLAVTWFFEPGSDTLKSLSPLALAFLAGYSVEILFAAMDRFVSAFSTGSGHVEEGAKSEADRGKNPKG